MKDHTVVLDEGSRQIVLLALAKLSIERPGWLDAIADIALKMDNHTAEGKPELFYEFRRIHEGGATVIDKLSRVSKSCSASVEFTKLKLGASQKKLCT